jgi:hypothetical protein
MTHKAHGFSVYRLAHAAELALLAIEFVDHLVPDAIHHKHDWVLRGEPELHGRSVLAVEGCKCGALRCDRLAYDADRLCFKRMGTTIV